MLILFQKGDIIVKNGLSLLIVAVVLFTAAFACNVSTANMSSFKLTKDKDGKEESSSFKNTDTLYGRATVANNGGKVSVKIQMNADDVAGMKKGDIVPGSSVNVNLDGEGVATYSLPLGGAVKAGKYTVVADMINDAGEKKDSKSVNISIAGDSSSTTAKPDTSKSDTNSEDKDDEK